MLSCRPSISQSDPTLSLDLMPFGAMLIDSGLRILQWNRKLEEWTGISPVIAIGQRLTDLFPNVSEPKYLNRLRSVFDAGLPATYSAAFHKHFLRVPPRNGLDCEWMIQQTDVRRLADNKSQAFITIQDVSFQYVQLERLRAEQSELMATRDALATSNEALVRQNLELDDFAKMASHDLQEPLRSIRHLVDFLREDCGDQLDENGQAHLDGMCEASDRMNSLIRDILLLSQMAMDEDTGEDVDLNLVVSEVLECLKQSISESDANVIVPSLPTIVGNRRLITQLFQNLIGNALKFASEIPKVTITARFDETNTDKPFWVFGVRDNGIGIDPKFSKKIFEPFQRLHARKAYAGTGVGLAICQKCVSHHCGEIWVDSDPGHGAHFQFTLLKMRANLKQN